MDEPNIEVIDSYTRVLDCPLNDDELLKRGDQAGLLKQQLDVAEYAEKQRAKDAKAGIARIEAELSRVLREIRTRSEQRDVDCEQHLLLDEKAVVTIRLDTGEEMTRRAATGNDLQREMIPKSE